MKTADTRYRHIIDTLNLQRKKLLQPLKLAAEVELAREYGVARTTIRRAMEELELQGAVTRRRGRGTFLHPSRTPLKQLQKSVIGFIPPWWADSTQAYYTSTVFDGVSKWIAPRDGNITTLHVDRLADDEHALLKQIERRGIEGLIWVHPVPTQSSLLAAMARHVPCVSIGREYPSIGLNMVIPDYTQAAQMMDDHLVSRGFSSFSVLGASTSDPLFAAFVDGFEAAARRRGSHFAPSSYVNISPFHRDKLADLLLDYHLPEGDDRHAMALTSSSYLVPLLASERFEREMRSRISILTFDYGLLPMPLYSPGREITHVACDWNQVGRQAMNVLAGLIQRQDQMPRVLHHPVTFVKGQTVHSLPKKDKE